MNIHDMLQMVVDQKASDLHIVAGVPASIRSDGALLPIQGIPPLTKDQVEGLVLPLMTNEQKDYVTVNKEIDFAYQFKDQGRFRVNVYTQRGSVAAALRLIPIKIKTLKALAK